jgi:hypothetical protein
MIPNMASDYWMMDPDHEVTIPDPVCPHRSYSPTLGPRLTACQTPHPVVSSHGIPISISPRLNGGRVDLFVHLVMSNNHLELGGPSTSSAASIVIDETLQGEFGREAQLRRHPTFRKADLQPLDMVLVNQYTPPYTPGGSHTESAFPPSGEVLPVGSEVHGSQVQAPKGRAHSTGARVPQRTTSFEQINTLRGIDTSPVEHAVKSQPNHQERGTWQESQGHVDTSSSVYRSHFRTRSPTRSLTRDDSRVRKTRPHQDYSCHSQRREVEPTSGHRGSNHQPYHSLNRSSMRGPSPDTIRRATPQRGRSPSPKSLVDDHEQVANRLDRDVSTTRTSRIRSQSYGAISGIESKRESLSRSRSRDVIPTRVQPRRVCTSPRMNAHPQPEWTQPMSPVKGGENDPSLHQEDEPLVVQVEGQRSLASRLEVSRKTSTPTTPRSEAELPVSESSRVGKMRSEDYGKDGRQTKRRLQDRISFRCPYSHKINGAYDCHDRNQPHPGYTIDEWDEIMEFVQRVGYAPQHLTKEGCVYHPAFKPPPREDPPPRSHPLNPFNVPPAAQGTDRYIPPPTPPPPMSISYSQAAPIPVSMPMPPFSSGPPPHTYPLHPGHMGTSHMNSFDNSGTYGERPIKKRRIGLHQNFRPASSDYGSQQAQSDQWPSQSMPPPYWGQQPPSNQPPTPAVRYTRHPRHPNAFHNQQGQPPMPYPARRKRPYDQR